MPADAAFTVQTNVPNDVPAVDVEDQQQSKPCMSTAMIWVLVSIATLLVIIGILFVVLFALYKQQLATDELDNMAFFSWLKLRASEMVLKKSEKVAG